MDMVNKAPRYTAAVQSSEQMRRTWEACTAREAQAPNSPQREALTLAEC